MLDLPPVKADDGSDPDAISAGGSDDVYEDAALDMLSNQLLLFAQDEASGANRKGLKKVGDAFKDDEQDAKNRGHMMGPPKIGF
jgi:hypothetical protein